MTDFQFIATCWVGGMLVGLLLNLIATAAFTPDAE